MMQASPGYVDYATTESVTCYTQLFPHWIIRIRVVSIRNFQRAKVALSVETSKTIWNTDKGKSTSSSSVKRVKSGAVIAFLTVCPKFANSMFFSRDF